MVLSGSRENGQNDRLSMKPEQVGRRRRRRRPASAPRAGPAAGGSSPANSPTQAQPNIWYGIQGPTPPVMQGGGEQGGAAEGEAEPGPEDPPGEHQGEEDRLDAGRARPRAAAGRRRWPRAPPAWRWPWRRCRRRRSRRRRRPAPAPAGPRTSAGPWWRRRSAPGATTNGQQKATKPTNEAMATTRDRCRSGPPETPGHAGRRASRPAADVSGDRHTASGRASRTWSTVR